jgi:hypothetical protein
MDRGKKSISNVEANPAEQMSVKPEVAVTQSEQIVKGKGMRTAVAFAVRMRSEECTLRSYGGCQHRHEDSGSQIGPSEGSNGGHSRSSTWWTCIDELELE